MNLDNITLKNKIEKKQVETIRITVEGKEYDLEVEKYHFEYPKHIQEETGILGYERKIINNNSFFELHKNHLGKILTSLSHGKYPDECLTHVMGAYALDDDIESGYKQNFSSDKFFLQKIYDVKRIKKEIEKGTNRHTIFNHDNIEVGSTGKNRIGLRFFNQKTNKEFPVEEKSHIL